MSQHSVHADASELIALMAAAKREPGEWKMRSFPARDRRIIREIVTTAGGCEIKFTPHGTSRELVAVSLCYGPPRRVSKIGLKPD